MGEGSRILRELPRFQLAYLVDALLGGRAFVGAELLIAEYRQPFLETELEPVAAGDPVAGPIVEVLVGDDTLDAHEAAVGGGLGRGQNEGIVEDVQSLILHCPHVEIRHSDNVEHVEVVFAPEADLRPISWTA